ncbi:PadR family transcriptional regulator [Boudabousia marimammalium]|uniref:PadR family transcriptional regulator n=1 Tax=Boudabousia marimammalium TaxID=156892 RepID=A0A1Q5PSE4_9ACTO|nr:PadR family transcriptional regulator [Boudabousia marimammalium]OKL50429.1 hypothetical protein BM477_00160 [Boudabousia marimammalium]
MSVKHALLALLARGESNTYQLRKDFLETTGQSWPLNIGQVYSTLQRLERDGLVSRGEKQPSQDGNSETEPFSLTEDGREELLKWWFTPVDREKPARSELVMKLALAASTPGVDVAKIVQTQRRNTMNALRDFTRLKVSATSSPAELPWQLVIENHIFMAEAELRWLDQIEGLVAAHQNGAAANAVSTTDTTALIERLSEVKK